MSITNKLLIAGFILLCIYAIISRIVNNRDNRDSKKSKDNDIDKNDSDKENKD